MTEPRTEAGRDTFDRWTDVVEDPERLLADILAIEAEAAAGPRDDLTTYVPSRDEAGYLDAKAAAGPRDEAVIDWLLHPDRSYTPHELAMETVRRIREAEAAAGPRDVPTLPPPDMSLIDTLGEGADPNRPVRIKR